LLGQETGAKNALFSPKIIIIDGREACPSESQRILIMAPKAPPFVLFLRHFLLISLPFRQKESMHNCFEKQNEKFSKKHILTIYLK
jgi:hypothetical protein